MINEPSHEAGLSSSLNLIQSRERNGPQPRPISLEGASSSTAQPDNGTVDPSDKFLSLQPSRTKESDDYVSSSKWRSRYRASRRKHMSSPHLEGSPSHDGPSHHSTRSVDSCETDCTEAISSASSSDSKTRRSQGHETSIQLAELKLSKEVSHGREISPFEHIAQVKIATTKTNLDLKYLPEVEPNDRFKSQFIHNSMPDIGKIIDEGTSSSIDYDALHPSLSSSEILTHRQMLDIQNTMNDESTLVFLMSEEIKRLNKERTETITSRNLMEISEEYGIPIAYTAARGLELIPKKLSDIKAIAGFIQRQTRKM